MHRSIVRTAALLASATLALVAGTADARSKSPRYAAEHPAIIHGSATTPTSYATRWSAMAAVLGTSSGGMALCGGAVIDERTVLTAAHCTFGINGRTLSPSAMEVIVGRRVAGSTEGDRISVSQITRHPSFNRTSLRNDIAVLRLSRSPNVAITPVTPTSAADQSWWGGGLGLGSGSDEVGPWIAGWGATNGSATSFPEELNEAKVPIAADSSCASSVAPGQGSNFDVNSMICAGVPGAKTGAGVDACQGDSGGPLIVGDGSGKLRLVGLTSWGQDCGGPYYGVYTRVGRFAAWIDSKRYQPSTTPPVDTPPPPPPPPPPPASTTPGDANPGSPNQPSGDDDGGGVVAHPVGSDTPIGSADQGPTPADLAIGPVVIAPAHVGANRRPSRPTLLRVVKRGHGWLRLGWRPSTDDGRVRFYRVLMPNGRGWRVQRTVTGTRATIRVTPGRVTTLRVQAVDDTGLRSPLSSALKARTS